MNSLKIDYNASFEMLKACIDNYKDDYKDDEHVFGYKAHEREIVSDLADHVARDKIEHLTDQEVFAEYFNFNLQVRYITERKRKNRANMMASVAMRYSEGSKDHVRIEYVALFGTWLVNEYFNRFLT